MPPRTCNATRCAHCGAVPPGFALKICPLTDDDLRWFFGQAAHDMGVRGSHGPLVDMALAGIQQSGGRANGAEERAVADRQLAASGKHRCILTRLGHLTQTQHAVLEALYGLGGWARAPELAQVRATIQSALGELVTALEGSARGCVIAACCRDDKSALTIIRAEAEALARDARSAACVTAWRPSSRVRGVTHPAGERRAPEPAYAPFDGEDLAGG